MDLLARVIAVAGLLVALGSIAVTWYLWQRSGPTLRVSSFVRADRGTLHLEITNSGRMPAVVRRIEVRDYFRLRTTNEWTRPVSRWGISLNPQRGAEQLSLPISLEPSSFVEADVEVARVFAKSDDEASEIAVRAWVQRGDGKWYTSRALRLR